MQRISQFQGNPNILDMRGHHCDISYLFLFHSLEKRLSNAIIASWVSYVEFRDIPTPEKNTSCFFTNLILTVIRYKVCQARCKKSALSC